MCNNNSPMINKKTRTKTRKPKYLSLRSELSPETTQQSGGEMITASTHQLNLFPLHPENLVEEKDTGHDENGVHEYFFSAADGGATTLTGLLGAETSSEDDNAASLTYAYRGQDDREEAVELVRTALRNRERDASEEEKWVRYSEVVERKSDEEVTSCIADLRYKAGTTQQQQQRQRQRQRLALKLDYEEILNAWSDKGPLYVGLESPQTVPALQDDDTPYGLMDGWGSSSNSNIGLWTVPENSLCSTVKMEKQQSVGDNDDEDQTMKVGQREASVLRYKEKRQNRLFSKRIRYQVRKLNAEKRPRIKGRFVKRS